MATVVNPVSSSSGKQVTLGVALSATELCVVQRGGSGARANAWRLPLQPLNGDGSGWPALTAALNELSRSLGVSGGRLEVALMPPLTEIRRLELPPMGETELRMLLSRNATRYFVGARAAQLVGTSVAPGRSADALTAVMAAATPARLVAALHAAAREAGWIVDAVSPAEGAWCSAATALWPAASRNTSHLLVCGEDRTELLQIDQGKLGGVRRFRGGAADAALVAEAIGPAAASQKSRITAVGAGMQRKELTRALAAAGLTVTAPPSEWAERADHADLIAAEFAGPNAAPLLRSEATLASKREQARRTIQRIAAASIVLLVLASGLTLWGAKRQLRAVQADRAAIKPLISATLVGRTSVENAFRQLAALAATQRTAPQWSDVISNLGVHLDDHAYLTSLRARDDSLLVEGIAVSAARAFDSMYQTPGIAGVKAAAPVRRESPQGGPALERFTIGAVVAPPVSNAIVPAAPTKKVSP
jgi:hypothetical protein